MRMVVEIADCGRPVTVVDLDLVEQRRLTPMLLVSSRAAGLCDEFLSLARRCTVLTLFINMLSTHPPTGRCLRPTAITYRRMLLCCRSIALKYDQARFCSAACNLIRPLLNIRGCCFIQQLRSSADLKHLKPFNLFLIVSTGFILFMNFCRTAQQILMQAYISSGSDCRLTSLNFFAKIDNRLYYSSMLYYPTLIVI